MKTTDSRTYVTPTSKRGQFGTEYRITVEGTLRGYVTGTRQMAEAEAARILRGIEFDRRWMAR